MDQDEYVLFIDETGTASPKDLNSSYYILAGCAIKETERNKLKIWSDRVKYKYWNNTDIVFHSREIGRKENDFIILGKHSIYTKFLTDLEDLLSKRDFHMFFVLVDKAQAKKFNWNDIKIYKETSQRIIEQFLLFLMSQKARGKIVVEAATAQKDFYFHRALNAYLAGGISSLAITHKQVKETLTSISFVTKQNYDIEEQVADLFAYAARCYYYKNVLKKPHRNGLYEDMMLRLFKQKMITKPKVTGSRKPKYLKNLNGFVTLP
jgi:hypothetical protein